MSSCHHLHLLLLGVKHLGVIGLIWAVKCTSIRGCTDLQKLQIFFSLVFLFFSLKFSHLLYQIKDETITQHNRTGSPYHLQLTSSNPDDATTMLGCEPEWAKLACTCALRKRGVAFFSFSPLSITMTLANYRHLWAHAYRGGCIAFS